MAQQYDTISLPHPYTHEAQIRLIDGGFVKGPLIDSKESSVFISATNKEDSVIEIKAGNIDFIKVFRSDFERSSTRKLVIVTSGGIAFFSSLNYFQKRIEDLRFENSEWLISGIATLVVMPVAALISNAIYLSPRENYKISGSQENFSKFYPELKAYSYWTYISSKKSKKREKGI